MVHCPFPQQDKMLELQVFGHRMILTRWYRPSEEHALSCMERRLLGVGVGDRHTTYIAGPNARNL